MLPTIIKNLIIINVLVFLAQITIGKNPSFPMDDLFALHAWQSPLFKPWQFVTYLFMHGGWDHLFFNMLALWMFGAILENLWGPKRFITFYLACGLGAALCHMVVLYFENRALLHDFYSMPVFQQQFYQQAIDRKIDEATLGASGAVFGCLAAFGYLFPNTYIYLYFFIPLKAKWFVILYAGLELFMAVRSSAGDNVAHVAHLGGALVGLLLVYFWNKNNRRTFY